MLRITNALSRRKFLTAIPLLGAVVACLKWIKPEPNIIYGLDPAWVTGGESHISYYYYGYIVPHGVRKGDVWIKCDDNRKIIGWDVFNGKEWVKCAS